MSALDTVSNFVSPSTMRVALRQSPEYVTNRNRVGAVLHDGFVAMDVYQQWKTPIFIASLVGMAGSGYAFEKRGRRPKNTEAMMIYGGIFLACAGIAWFTRPSGPSQPADAPPPADAVAAREGGVVAYVDKRVAALSDANPNFADEAFARLVSMPGVDTQFKAMNPLIQAVVV